jgi:uncharacterized membrane protein YkvA (DUF1232 family)
MLRALADRGIMTWKLFWDERVPLMPKLIPILTLVYMISPVDFLPELVFGPIGVVDDGVILLAALNLFIEASPADLVTEHLREIRQRFLGGGSSPDVEVIEGESEVLNRE